VRQKLGKDRPCGSGDVLADGQTDTYTKRELLIEYFRTPYEGKVTSGVESDLKGFTPIFISRNVVVIILHHESSNKRARLKQYTNIHYYFNMLQKNSKTQDRKTTADSEKVCRLRLHPFQLRVRYARWR